MDTLAKRVKAARLRLGLTQGDVAVLSGLKQPDISKIEKGMIQRTTGLLGLSRALQVNADWLDTGDGDPEWGSDPDANSMPVKLSNNPNYPSIQYVSFKLSAGASGFGIEYLHEAKRPLVFGREWYDEHGYQPSKLFAVKVANGSMEPGLHHGDTVVVNTGDTLLKDGEVFAMNYEGELVIKRMVRDNGEWWLSSDNPDQRRYPRKICGEFVFCIGRVVHKQSERI